MTTGGPAPGAGPARGQEPERWLLTLYVSGASPHSAAAVASLRRLCDTELPGMVELEIVDVHDEPALLVRDHILATPTLVKRLPLPLRRLVGNLSDDERVRIGLDLGAAVGDASAGGRSAPRDPDSRDQAARDSAESGETEEHRGWP